MSQTSEALEYKCPCCDAGLKFNEADQKLNCEYCGNSFDLEAVEAYNHSQAETDGQWEEPETLWSGEEQAHMQVFACPACGGEIMSDENTAATFCPYCENPAILTSRLSGGLKPDGVIPFKTSKEDAKQAFLNLCKGKPLLPKMFTEQQRIEKITGIYVPFWLYDVSGRVDGTYKATRIRTWSDARYRYTKTDHFLLSRSVKGDFLKIPVDGSQKLDDAIMESVEPYDYSQMVDFNTAYLSGFFADKYDVGVKAGHPRVKERVSDTLTATMRESCIGYSSVVPVSTQVHIDQGKARYVLLPVWMLHTKYEDQTYVFAMNGQTGRMTGNLPVCRKRAALWFGAIAGGTALLAGLVQCLAQLM